MASRRAERMRCPPRLTTKKPELRIRAGQAWKELLPEIPSQRWEKPCCVKTSEVDQSRLFQHHEKWVSDFYFSMGSRLIEVYGDELTTRPPSTVCVSFLNNMRSLGLNAGHAAHSSGLNKHRERTARRGRKSHVSRLRWTSELGNETKVLPVAHAVLSVQHDTVHHCPCPLAGCDYRATGEAQPQGQLQDMIKSCMNSASEISLPTSLPPSPSYHHDSLPPSYPPPPSSPLNANPLDVLATVSVSVEESQFEQPAIFHFEP